MKKHTKIIAKIGNWIAMYENDIDDTCYFCKECECGCEKTCNMAEDKAEELIKKIKSLISNKDVGKNGVIQNFNVQNETQKENE